MIDAGSSVLLPTDVVAEFESRLGKLKMAGKFEDKVLAETATSIHWFWVNLQFLLDNQTVNLTDKTSTQIKKIKIED